MDIFKKLIDLRNKSYARYSKYRVACIIVDDNNNEHCGVNVENAVYPLSFCAEQCAIGCGVSNGMKRIKEVHLLCSNGNLFGIPCGACRQVISEFMDKENKIYVYNDLGEIKTFKLEDLLPVAFDNNYLGGN